MSNNLNITAADVAAMNSILEKFKNTNQAIVEKYKPAEPSEAATQVLADSEYQINLRDMQNILSKYNTAVEQPVSERIKDRLVSAGVQFFASDNIADHIEDGEKEELIEELTEKFQAVLSSLVIDTQNDPNSAETGKRLAKMYVQEIMSGRYDSKPNVTAFPNEGTGNYEGMIVIRAEINSICSHHHKDVDGVAYIGIIPNGKVLGLSKYIRLAQWAARRGTLQEELTTRIANLISSETGSQNVAVYIQAEHGCVSCRGVQQDNSLTQTTVLLGGFKEDPKVREEFYHNVLMQAQYRK